mgnify:CR=1 FL=1
MVRWGPLLSVAELLAHIRAVLGTPLLRNERQQTDRAWYGNNSFWTVLAVGWPFTWAATLVPVWLVGPYWWLVAAPIMFFPIMLLAWSSSTDVVVLLQRERRDHTVEDLILTTADRQDLLWTKLVTGLRTNLVLSLSCLPLGGVAGALVWARNPECADKKLWAYLLGGLMLGTFSCLASLSGALTCGAIGVRAAISRLGLVRQFLLAAAMTSPVIMLDLLFVAAPVAAVLATWRTALSGCPLTPVEVQILNNALASVGLSQDALQSVGLSTWLACSAVLFAFRLLVLNLWLPLRVMRYCAEHFDERLLPDD